MPRPGRPSKVDDLAFHRTVLEACMVDGLADHSLVALIHNGLQTEKRINARQAAKYLENNI